MPDRARDEGPAVLQLELRWWSNPVFPVLVFGALVAAWTWALPEDQFTEWGVRPAFLTEHLGIAVVGVLAMCVGILVLTLRTVGATSTRVILSDTAVRRLRALQITFFSLVVAAYVLWVLVAVRTGASAALVLDVLAGERGAVSNLKDVSAPVAGVTTLTQLAPVVAGISVVLSKAGRQSRAWVLPVVVALSLGRALLYGERLALIEVVIPVLLLHALFAGAGSRVKRLTARALPLLAVPALWATFAVFEYTRSWAARNDGSHGTFTQYVTSRLIGYYATSINNSALYYNVAHDRPHIAYYPVQGLWEAPIVGDVVRRVFGEPSIGGVPVGEWWAGEVAQQGSVEFVNTGTVLVVAADLGYVGMVLYFLAIGLAVGALYAAAARGRVAGLIGYAVVFVGLLEMSRILYLGQGRFLVTAVGVAVTAIVLHRPERAPTVEATARPGLAPPPRFLVPAGPPNPEPSVVPAPAEGDRA
ncbi:O-antigen polymerase [Cellulomonas sp. NPDC057328]|uniref:O-antigen polymerase n=1 Tax=Cellulomonas sp. NPDC057328 TaxID=3346101 RepID=UPI003632189F